MVKVQKEGSVPYYVYVTSDCMFRFGIVSTLLGAH